MVQSSSGPGPIGGDPNLQRVFYGALALLGLVALVAGGLRAGAPGVAFGLMALLTIGGALACVWERSVVRSAFALMATFMGTAGLFVLLEADFLAMAQVLIYVGGILALLLFGVMLTPPDLGERKLTRVLGGLAVVGAATVWIGLRVAASANFAAQPVLTPGETADPVTAKDIGIGFLAYDQYVIPFELAAVLLTVALVASVYIARRKRSDYAEERR
jgi:NADH-quinone oxidoreductase subunit J